MKTLSFTFTLIFPAMLWAVPAQIPDNGNEKWATVRGQIVFDGDVPQPQPNGFVDRNGKPPRQVQNWIVHPKTKGVKNVFVWISSDADKVGTRMPIEQIHPNLRKAPTKAIEIDNSGMEFSPSALGMRQGQSLIFKNTSREVVNFRCDGRESQCNVIVPVDKSHTIADLKADTMPLRLTDCLHQWMQGYVRVFEHPYFTVTDENGKFEIPLVPTGKMRLFIWHPDMGYRNGAAGKKGEPIEVKSRQFNVGAISIKPLP